MRRIRSGGSLAPSISGLARVTQPASGGATDSPTGASVGSRYEGQSSDPPPDPLPPPLPEVPEVPEPLPEPPPECWPEVSSAPPPPDVPDAPVGAAAVVGHVMRGGVVGATAATAHARTASAARA
jgi:hypothetical protein